MCLVYGAALPFLYSVMEARIQEDLHQITNHLPPCPLLFGARANSSLTPGEINLILCQDAGNKRDQEKDIY